MKPTVTRPGEVVANIRRFEHEAASNPRLAERLGRVHAWYALRLDAGDWAFGPSKFVGYPDNSASDYLASARTEADGGRTEKTLREWFTPVDPASALGRELAAALAAFLARFDQKPRSGARISIASDDPAGLPGVPRLTEDALLARIVSDPDVCGGRPCIRGTRMRVSDIVDMLAHGATTAEILEDFPYLAGEDIAAALAYAARATDHRVIRAA